MKSMYTRKKGTVGRRGEDDDTSTDLEQPSYAEGTNENSLKIRHEDEFEVVPEDDRKEDMRDAFKRRDGGETSADSNNSIKPTRVYSAVSAKYDLNKKGYLDETERALRLMDSQNLGYLSMDKMYALMEGLQTEQKKSAVLLQQLQDNQSKALNLKRTVLSLGCFAILLAVSNIGTSIAAARLSKDTTVSRTTELVFTGNGQRIATTSRLVEIEINPIADMENTTLRNLLVDRVMAKRRDPICELNSRSNTATCEVQGYVSYKEAASIYQQFCPDWDIKQGNNGKCGGGVEEVVLKCRAGRAVLYGGVDLPQSPTVSSDEVIFPKRKKGYKAQQMLGDCIQDFTTGMHCYTDGEPCVVMASWDSECDRPVKMCGIDGDYY